MYHSRSKSFGGAPLSIPPPPSDSAMGRQNHGMADPASPSIYRKHSRKKSSQILVEPIGAHANYVPMSPTIAVPHGLEAVLNESGTHSKLGKKTSLSNMTTNLHPTSAAAASTSYYSPQFARAGSNGNSYPQRHYADNDPYRPGLVASPLAGSGPSYDQSSSSNAASSTINHSNSMNSVNINHFNSNNASPMSPYVFSGYRYPPSGQSIPADTHSQTQTPMHHSQPPLVVPTPRTAAPARGNSLHAPRGHSRTLSLGVEFGRSKSLKDKYHPDNNVATSFVPPLPPLPANLSKSTGNSSIQTPPLNNNYNSNYIPNNPNNQTEADKDELAIPPHSKSNNSRQAGSGSMSQLQVDTALSNTVPDVHSNAAVPNTPYLPTTSAESNSVETEINGRQSRSTSSGSIGSPVLSSPPRTPVYKRSSPNLNPKPSYSKLNSATGSGHNRSMSMGVRNRVRSGSVQERPATLKPPSPSETASSPSASSFSANTLASGATFLIAGQFFSKLVTFGLNQIVLRFVGPEVFGANSQLELLINTILFFSREAIRLATQRQSLAGKRPDVYRFEGGVVAGTLSGTVQEVINIGFLSTALGIPLAVIFSFLYIHFNASTAVGQGVTVASSDDYKTVTSAVIIFAVSAIIELAAEPSFLLFQLKLQFRKRASFESIAVTCRCLLTFLFTVLDARGFVKIGSGRGTTTSHTSIIAFALGQLAYSGALATLYIFNGLRDARTGGQYEVTMPCAVWKDIPSQDGTSTHEVKTYINSDTKQLAQSIWLQTVFKHCLTEGDKFLISMLLPMTDQGVYAVVVNYGSLIARLVFLPIEEALRNFFSKLLCGAATSSQNMQLSVTVLSTLLRFYTYLSLLAVTFGPVVAAYVLRFLVSQAWFATDAPVVLATYACYIPFLAINGALEAFVQSVASSQEIKHQSSIMCIFSASFAAAAYLLMKPFGLGPQGLVLANMFNMAQRIGWCVMWIEHYYAKLRESSSSVSEAKDNVFRREKLADERVKALKEEAQKEKAVKKTAKNEEKLKEKAEYKKVEKENDKPDSAKSSGKSSETTAHSRNTKLSNEPKSRSTSASSTASLKSVKSVDSLGSVQTTTSSRSTTSFAPVIDSKESLDNLSQALNSLQAESLQYRPWGWLYLSVPRLFVLLPVIFVAMPVSWIAIGRVGTAQEFFMQCVLAGAILILVAFAEKEMVLQSARDLFAIIKRKKEAYSTPKEDDEQQKTDLKKREEEVVEDDEESQIESKKSA